jgi:hypothetical protein
MHGSSDSGHARAGVSIDPRSCAGPATFSAGARIEAIRRAYAQVFWQGSVLRADGTACVWF